MEKTVGVIGSGRITRVIPRRLKRAEAFPVVKMVANDQGIAALEGFPKVDV